MTSGVPTAIVSAQAGDTSVSSAKVHGSVRGRAALLKALSTRHTRNLRRRVQGGTLHGIGMSTAELMVMGECALCGRILRLPRESVLTYWLWRKETFRGIRPNLVQLTLPTHSLQTGITPILTSIWFVVHLRARQEGE